MNSPSANRPFSLLVIIAMIAAITASVQEAYAQMNNAVYAELGGAGGVYSINYERSFSNNTVTRGGISFFNKNFVLPVHFGKFFGKGSHHVEVDLGLSFVHGKTQPLDNPQELISSTQLATTAFLGYRYQKPDKRSLFRIGYTPGYKVYDSTSLFDRYFTHWAGVSYGLRF